MLDGLLPRSLTVVASTFLAAAPHDGVPSFFISRIRRHLCLVGLSVVGTITWQSLWTEITLFFFYRFLFILVFVSVCACVPCVYASVHLGVQVCAWAPTERIDRTQRNLLVPYRYIVNLCSLCLNTFLHMTNAVINYSQPQLSWHPSLWKPFRRTWQTCTGEAGPRDIPKHPPQSHLPLLHQSNPPRARTTG